MIETNQIICGDCTTVIKTIENESIDLIITDPPYLMNYRTNHRTKEHEYHQPIAGDDDDSLISKIIPECYRVLKNNSALYMFCNSNRIDFFVTEIKKVCFNIKNIIVWVKPNHTAGDLRAAFAKQHEFIILANKGRKLFNGKRIRDVWHFPTIPENRQLHRNQKPVELLELCVEKHSNEGDLILDPFAGVGSTLIACRNKQRRYIGIEIDFNYCKLAQQRLDLFKEI